ncbi:acetyl-CoA carboxylase biotin carboxyl carrier protein [Cytobacillus oceanisediminis]|jgi:acetyl-CoA carboxylase biotin carboxyl carrier protein|uniref:Biotin carboxyl carrier protein of acetyl-CoA carboxylase n=1 Tax=Niallia circulans TaxID=1397 RepID=A0A941JPK7_NIACI|nr:MULTISPECIES: acetyl-CoA carboxylase biotin carboxyl carrier protein [Bacillaceae]MBQ6447413.1 acetyl-CoA carboxylase biotin carboxyl carrier protein [Bacillus sp. (in: firmicutes)]MBZ9533489.1 acetyl-CoA carboxylase biotin carboxyl carrier protein [Cytobacillus oceanisediminis]MCB5235871.1 acetyl-CoA carboxylase biotin carboxyl carrier protein [Niallia circulans]MED3791309.1 acetyl-CoA carboxylase biotin carboxyl carrier protein [Niallia alba]UTI41672.1 acetyl-CoA carboxylase biotin carbox
MLKISEVKELIKLIDDSTISNFLYEQDGVKVEIKKNVGEAVVAAPVVTKTIQQEEAKTTKEVAVESVVTEAPEKSIDENLHKITSPMVGTFYQSASPDTPAFIKVGDKVTKDSVVCIVEAMKLFNEITAEVDGEIVEILVKDGELVEYGEPLFLVKA